jgi:hypothetical protein
VNASRRRRSPLRGSVGCARRARCDSACYAICGSWARCSRSLTRVIRTSAARGGMCSFCAGTTERDLFLRAQTATITLGHRGQVWSVVRVVAQWSHPVGPTQNPVRLKPRVGSTPTSGTNSPNGLRDSRLPARKATRAQVVSELFQFSRVPPRASAVSSKRGGLRARRAPHELGGVRSWLAGPRVRPGAHLTGPPEDPGRFWAEPVGAVAANCARTVLVPPGSR